MARDGVFFQAVGKLSPRTRVPVIAVVLQGVWAAIVAMTGRYEQILNYVVTIDVLFFGLTGASLLVFRARARREGTEAAAIGGALGIQLPLVFVPGCWSLAITRSFAFPKTPASASAFLAGGGVVYASGRHPACQVGTPRCGGRKSACSP